MSFLSTLGKIGGKALGFISSPAGSLVSTGLGIAGNLISGKNNNDAAIAQQKLYNQGQMDVAKYQYDRSVDLWNMQNEYNTPAAQMERYKEAGLNPNLIYGNGVSSAGNASSPAQLPSSPDVKSATLDYGYMASLGTQLMNGIQSAMDISKKKAETDSIYQSIANMQVDNELKKLDVIYKGYRNSQSSEDAELHKNLLFATLANLDSSTLSNRASAFNTDASRFTTDALRPLITLQARYTVENQIEDVIGKRQNNSLYGYRKQKLVAEISDLVSRGALSRSTAEKQAIEKDIMRVLRDSGLDIKNDEAERVVYRLKNQFIYDSGQNAKDILDVSRIANMPISVVKGIL